MAPITKKRSRPDKNQDSRKRRKTSIDQNASQEENTDPKAIALDELPWSAVSLPDRLEDAEGFYGLEEIADVEIIRNVRAGKLEYRVGKKSSNDGCHFGTEIVISNRRTHEK